MNSFLDRDLRSESRSISASLVVNERQYQNLMAGRQYTISVKLTPERLLYAGPVIPGAWTHSRDQAEAGSIGGEILIDTGAFGAMIDVDAADRLRLPILGTKEIHGIHGYGTVRCYQAKLVLPAQDTLGEDCTFTTIIESIGVPSLTEKNRDHGVNVIGIIGRQFLQNVHLEIDGATGKLKLLITDSIDNLHG
jgi:predicted aspartyl protease